MNTTPVSRRLRSLLFVPADRPDRVAKAVAAGPDAVIVDLEDAVHPDRLPAARAAAAAALRDVRGTTTALLTVRVHGAGHPALAADLAAVVGPWLDAVMLPKVDGAGDVAHLDTALARAEHAVGLPDHRTGILPLVESCRGLRDVHDSARASDRVTAMVFSSGEEGDFMADLGGRWTPDGLALAYPRSRFICDVRAAGDLPAIDGVCMTLGDPDVLRSECEIGRTMGFDGKLAIHPSQLPAIHAAFSPSDAEVTRARGLLAALDAARARGAGVATYEGRMIDPANARLARRVLRLAGAHEAAGDRDDTGRAAGEAAGDRDGAGRDAGEAAGAGGAVDP